MAGSSARLVGLVAGALGVLLLLGLVGAALRMRDLQTAANVAQLVSVVLAVPALVVPLWWWARGPADRLGADRTERRPRVATGADGAASPRRRRATAIAAGVVGIVVVVLAVVTALAVRHGSDLAPTAPVATPLTPSTAPPITEATALPPEGTQNVLSVAPDKPAGCSTSYLVTGAVRAAPDLDAAAIWVVDELYASPSHNDPNDLYFAKARVTLKADGKFTVRIPGNTETGVRDGRFLLVASPSDAADQDLALSLASNQAADNRYPDGRRTRLQLGNVEIATSSDLHQECPNR